MIGRYHPASLSARQAFITWFDAIPVVRRYQEKVQYWIDNNDGPIPAFALRNPELPSDLLERLWNAFDQKCAYCEQGIGTVAEAALNMYRPQFNARQSADSTTHQNFYQWLRWDARNMYLSCQKCAEVKDDVFPIEGDRRQTRGLFGDALRIEQPLLLDLCYPGENPLLHLRFSADGRVAARNQSRRGSITIEILKLNRPELVAQRLLVVSHFSADARLLLRQATTSKRESKAQDAIRQLLDSCADDKPFAGLKRCLLADLITKSKPSDRPAWAQLLSEVQAWFAEWQALDSPGPSAVPSDATIDRPVNASEWRRLLTAYFNESELRDLCFDIGVDYEILPGQAKPDKARELIAYAERHDLTARLLAECRALRPRLDWSAVNRSATSETAPPPLAGARGNGQALPAPAPPVDIVLITALKEEREALLACLPGHQRLSQNGSDDMHVYYGASVPVRSPNGHAGTYDTIVCQLPGMGRVRAAAATKDIVQRWHPRYLILVGIAGGIASKGVACGDVLVASQIVDYELQKITPDGPQVRWEVFRSDTRLAIAADHLSDDWKAAVRVARPEPGDANLHVGPVASGDKVIAFEDVLRQHRAHWPALIGVEMEAAGVAAANFQSPAPLPFFMVRGVSDLADQAKGDGWRNYACAVAATYTVALLESGPLPPGRP